MDGWIKKTDRLPTREDCDPQGCILVWHIHQNAMVYGVQGFIDNDFMTYWQRTPDPPEEYKRDKSEK